MVIVVAISVHFFAPVSDRPETVMLGWGAPRAFHSTRSGADPTSVSPFRPHPWKPVAPPLARGGAQALNSSQITL